MVEMEEMRNGGWMKKNEGRKEWKNTTRFSENKIPRASLEQSALRRFTALQLFRLGTLTRSTRPEHAGSALTVDHCFSSHFLLVFIISPSHQLNTHPLQESEALNLASQNVSRFATGCQSPE